MTRLLISFFALLILTSCVVEKNKEPLLGEWTLADWRIKNTEQKIGGQKMDFTFKENDRYLVDYGSEQEKGDWHVAGNNLYTTEDGNVQKMVVITKLENDTLQFDMNRSGRLETVTLVKKE